MYERSVVNFGGWLKMRRRTLGWTQLELARQVFCAEITIRKIEANQLRPSKQLAELILNAVQVAPMEDKHLYAWVRGQHQ